MIVQRCFLPSSTVRHRLDFSSGDASDVSEV